MDSVGTVNTSCIVEYDPNCPNYVDIDSKLIIKVNSSSLDDVINLFKDQNFENFMKKASDCFIVCVEVENNEEEEELDEKSTSWYLNSAFSDKQRLIIVELFSNLWIRQCYENTFRKLRCLNFNYTDDILKVSIDFTTALRHQNSNPDQLTQNMLKLFDFNDKLLNEIYKVSLRFKLPINSIENLYNLCKNSFDISADFDCYNIISIILTASDFNDEIRNDITTQLTDNEMAKVTDEIGKLNDKSLLEKLRSRCSVALSHDFKKEENERILIMLKNIIDLNHEGVNPLLKAVDDMLDITIDFQSDSIERSYPIGGTGESGNFDPNRMLIVVGAKNNGDSRKNYEVREWDIMGSLIHEICHFVCYKVFDNNCMPYRRNKDEQEYKEIINEYEKWQDHHEIVDRVYKNYKKPMWDAELIVRVVQMIVTYKVEDPERLKELEVKYQKLFSFYIDKIIPQIKEYIKPENDLKRQINQVSSFKLDQLNMKPVKKEFKYDKETFIHFVQTNSLKMAMTNLNLNFLDDLVIFLTFKDLMDEFKANKIYSLWGKHTKIKIVIGISEINVKSGLYEIFIEKLTSSLRTNHTFLIFKEHSKPIKYLREKIQQTLKEVENLEIMNFNFTDLTEDSKETILQKKIIFQGIETELNKIIKKDSKVAQFLPINHFLESAERIAIGKLPEKNADYDDKVFIQRNLINKNEDQVKEFSTENMEEILTLLSTQQYIIISDEVGKGKSTLMTYLAYQFLHSKFRHIEGNFFVIKINLHLHVNILEEFNVNTKLVDFIFTNFVKSSKFEEFEKKLFEEYFGKGKVILMLDGFDEIAAACETQELRIIQEASSLKLSNVIVATRPFFLNNLETSNAVIMNLNPISWMHQEQFLINYFKSQRKLTSNFRESELNEIVQNIKHKFFASISEDFENHANEKLFLSYPLHLKMFAEVISNKIIKSNYKFEDAINSIKFLNMFQIYDEFFQNKLSIAKEDKGDVVKNEIKNLERRRFKRPEFFNCARKLAWNTLHPSFKDHPLTFDETEKSLLQYYGVITMHNNQIYFIHRSYAEFFIADLFFDNLHQGEISANFALDNFLFKMLSKHEHETIKIFIDTALSDRNFYDEISNESFECFGKFIIKEFKNLEGNEKNFLHCVFYHDLKELLRILPRKDFVFVSHLIIQSLTCCNDQKDIEEIKNILQLPWDINNIPEHLKPDDYRYLYTSETGKNLFHLTCELGINSLMLIVWDLARKVFQEDAKDYFLAKSSTSRYDPQYDATAYAFRRIERNKGKFTLQHCLTIDELQSFSNGNILEEINLNGSKHFEKSSLYHLFNIMKSIGFSDEKVYKIYTSNINLISDYKFIALNLQFYLISDIFTSESDFIKFICVDLSCLSSEIILNSLNTEFFLNYLKQKLSQDHLKMCFVDIFALSMQSICNDKASILYVELKNIYNDVDLKLYFENWPNFFNLYQNENYNPFSFTSCLQTYFFILDEDYLTLLLLNETTENPNIIKRIFCKFGNTYPYSKQLIFELLESRYSDKIKLLYIIDQSHILEASTFSEENFSLVYEFCFKHFEKSEIVALLYLSENREKISLKHINVLNKIMDLFKEIFDFENWKQFFFQTYKNDETLIHELLKNNLVENANVLIEIAKNKLGDDFESLMNLKDLNGNSIASLKIEISMKELKI